MSASLTVVVPAADATVVGGDRRVDAVVVLGAAVVENTLTELPAAVATVELGDDTDVAVTTRVAVPAAQPPRITVAANAARQYRR